MNKAEAHLVLVIYRELVHRFPNLRKTPSVGVISPYKAQVLVKGGGGVISPRKVQVRVCMCGGSSHRARCRCVCVGGAGGHLTAQGAGACVCVWGGHPTTQGAGVCLCVGGGAHPPAWSPCSRETGSCTAHTAHQQYTHFTLPCMHPIVHMTWGGGSSCMTHGWGGGSSCMTHGWG